MTDANSAVAPTRASERAAVWEDFIDIFYAPSQVFARRITGSVWVPLLVVTVAMSALIYVNSGVLEPMMSAEFDRGMAVAMKNNPRLTPEMMGQMRNVGLRVAQFGGFLMPILVLLTGSALWLIGKLFDAKQKFSAAILVTAYGFMPKVLEEVVHGVQGLFLDPAQLDGRFRVSLGVGRFLDPNTVSPILLGLVGRLDVFTIWVTVLLAIGLSVTGGIPRTRAFIAAPLIWAVGAIPLVFQAMRG
jgi:Yip1 domain